MQSRDRLWVVLKVQSAKLKPPTQEPTMGVYQKRERVAKPSTHVSLRVQLPWLFSIVQLLEEAKQTASETFDQLKQKLFELVLEASAGTAVSRA
ncbi:MAG TPA: hypothetical protein PKD72_10190 [Gemmatales bacterium]|nr:hypothetical protein [Gemmatales bacterium]